MMSTEEYEKYFRHFDPDLYDPREWAKAAKAAGLREICFTDHLAYDPLGRMGDLTFRTEDYNAEYDALSLPGLTIRRGVEFGLARDN